MMQAIVIVAIVCLYSTRHWIGATVLLAFLVWGIVEEVKDPTGLRRLFRSLRN